MKVLELFSGTGSIGKCCKELGYEVLSLDNELPADINIDILEWDYKEYKTGDFDIIWASPPCTQYSKAKSRGIRDIDGANKIVLKTLEIIKYFAPKYYFIENPQTGLLKNQEFMKNLNYYDCDYCMYGKPYRKRTRIWTNKENLKLLLCDKNCGSFFDNKHQGSCGNGNKKYTDKNYSQKEKYTIPSKLIYDLFL